MGKNTWMIVAIIFIVLFAVETISVLYLLNVGMNQIEMESLCSNFVCAEGGYASFTYDTNTDVCACYDETGEIAYTERLK